MRKNENSEIIEGRLFAKNIEEKVTGETSKAPGTHYLSGTIDIATDEEGLNVIQIHYTYVTAKTKAGADNRTFGALTKIMNGKTWTENGKDEAMIVRCQPSIALNDFYPNGGEGELVSQVRSEGGFITILSDASKLKPVAERNTFKADVVITKIDHVEADEEKGTNDYVAVKAAAFDFRNAILPITFRVTSEEGMKYFESLGIDGSAPLYTQVWGNIEAQTITTTKEIESAFGAPKVETVNKTIRNWVITGMKSAAYDFGGEDLSEEEFKKAIADRNVYLAEQKKNAQEWASKKGDGTANDATSFGGTAAPAAKSADFKF